MGKRGRRQDRRRLGSLAPSNLAAVEPVAGSSQRCEELGIGKTTLDAYKPYATHPEHLRVRRALGDLRVARHQADYRRRGLSVHANKKRPTGGAPWMRQTRRRA